MNPSYQLNLPPIKFGVGCLDELGPAAVPLGKKALLVRGQGSLDLGDRMGRLGRSLAQSGIGWVPYMGSGEPSCEAVDRGADLARTEGCDFVIAAGGGSTLDLGKAIAALCPNGPHVKPYLEEVGNGSRLGNEPLPLIALPTTAGTGCEATWNAVIGNAAEGFKRSLRHPGLLPHLALVDPALALGAPKAVTLASGFDAFTQLIESYTSRRLTQPVADLVRPVIGRVGRALWQLREGRDGLDLRTDMAHGALISGIALSHVGLGVVHALASPLGGLLDMPHAHVCARLLPFASVMNTARLAEMGGDPSALKRYREIENELGSSILDFCANFDFPGLAHYGLKESHFAAVAAGAGKGNLKANPVDFSPEQLAELLSRAL